MTTDEDFPNTSGKIEFDSNFLDNKNRKELFDFIDYSIESTDKVIGDQREYEEFINNEEFKYQSIIDSLEWRLISKDGVVTKILVPVFFRDNEINFRFQ
ncbi:MAG: hypothetical protein ACK5PC_22360 [Cyclobacteriaceae bacterium]